MSPLKNLIGGRWVDGTHTFETRNPANLDEVVAVCANASTEQVAAAADAARAAFGAWSALSTDERVRRILAAGEAITAAKDEIAELISRDNGKKLPDAQGEVLGSTFAISYLPRIASGANPWTLHHAIDKKRGAWAAVLGEPAGVGALITPFNFPFWTPITKLISALAAGCTIVLKPASDAPAPTHRMIQLFQETGGFPDGVLNFVMGDGIGRAFTSKENIRRWDRLSFTGGTETGLSIAGTAAEANVPVALELGGLNELVLGPDVQVEDKLFGKFLRFAYEGMLCNGGQMCTAVSRLVVPEEHYAAVAEALSAKLREAKMGPGLGEGVMVTPLTGPARLREIAELTAKARANREGELLVGGNPASRLEGFESGTGWRMDADPEKSCFMEPTLFGRVDPNSAVLGQTEIFGPVAHIVTYPADRFERVLEINATCPFGLHAGIVTGDGQIAARYAAGAKVGTIFVNKLSVFADPRVPFGGMKLSGNGEKELGPDALHFWQSQKSVEFDEDTGLYPEARPAAP